MLLVHNRIKPATIHSRIATNYRSDIKNSLDSLYLE